MLGIKSCIEFGSFNFSRANNLTFYLFRQVLKTIPFVTSKSLAGDILVLLDRESLIIN